MSRTYRSPDSTPREDARATTPTLREDARATTSTLNYVLAIGIITVLMSGLLVATNDQLSGQRDAAAREAMRDIGDSLAGVLVE
ncbi:hypothetical protein ACFQE1_07730, partial [Halobium palmae]